MSTPVTANPACRYTPGPLHAIMAGGTVALFLGALLSDIAYFQTYQIQWNNFAAWLIAGALVFCGIALLFALANLIRTHHRAGRPVRYVLLLAATWVLGLFNAFEHARDAWASMPGSLILSVIVTLLAVASAWVGLGSRREVAP